MASPDFERPVFLIGMPRSGTSVISEAISLHEELGWLSNHIGRFPSLPALSVLNRLTSIPGLGRHLRGKKADIKGPVSALQRLVLPFSEEGFGVWTHLCGPKAAYDYLLGQEASPEERQRVRRYLAKVLRYQGRSRLFAKFTGPPRIRFLDSLFDAPCYLHLIRDPRAVVSSLVRFRFWIRRGGLEEFWWLGGATEEDIADWERYDRSPVALNAVQWRRVIEQTWKERDLVPPERFVEVRYEEFVADPHGILSDLFRRFGLPDSPAAHRFLDTRRQMRSMNYKFRQKLDPEQVACIESLTGEVAARAGYEFAG